MEAMECILRSGIVDVNSLNSVSRAKAMHIALGSSTSAAAAVQLLLDHGADPMRREVNASSLALAALYGHTAVVKVILNHSGIPDAAAAAVNNELDGQPLLILAAQAGHADVTRLLLEAGAECQCT
jgi:ankyrin repeat protein